MHFSCKIKKFYEGMQVYEHLLEDEKAIHIPFALSFTVTIATINGQLRAYLLDLENKVCQEIPDIDFDLMTDIYNIMSPKLKRDMAAFGNKTIRQILEELFGEQLDKTPAEMHSFIFDNTLLMTEYLKKIRKELDHAEPMLFEGYVCRHIREHNWDDIEDGYLKWKQKHSEITLEMLLEKQEQELQRYLERGVMRFAQKPSINKMGEVDYDWHRGHLDCDFVGSEEYKKAYTQMMQFASRKDGMLTIDLKRYGKYIFVNYYKFSEGQKVALFELCVILDLIHEDMAGFGRICNPPASNLQFDVTADTPLSALFREECHEELTTVIESWRPYLKDVNPDEDALHLSTFHFDLDPIQPSTVYLDFARLISQGALMVPMSNLAAYMFSHSNLSKSENALYVQLKRYKRMCEQTRKKSKKRK